MNQINKIDELVGSEYNPRKIDKVNLEALKLSLSEFGDISGIVFNSTTGRLVSGHQRLKALKDEFGNKLTISNNIITTPKGEHFPIRVVSWDEAKEKAANVAANSHTLQGEFTESLNDLLAEIQLSLPDLFSGLHLSELHLEIEDKLTIKEDDDALPEEVVNPISQLGDLWILGTHRLLCGDSTQAESYNAVMMQDIPTLMVTDPPYGVNYDPEWRYDVGLSQEVNPSKKTLKGKVLNDDQASWYDVYKHFTGNVMYVWHASLNAHIVREDILKCGFDVKYQIIWGKQSFVISRGDYHFQHEPCFYAVRKGKNHNWQGARDQSTLWSIANLRASSQDDPSEQKTGHGTQKPVECMLKPILNNSQFGDIIYEPFCGSGSTIIAAEKSGRHVRAIELSPNYVDQIIIRWQNFTGKNAIHVGTNKTYDELNIERGMSNES